MVRMLCISVTFQVGGRALLGVYGASQILTESEILNIFCYCLAASAAKKKQKHYAVGR